MNNKVNNSPKPERNGFNIKKLNSLKWTSQVMEGSSKRQDETKFNFRRSIRKLSSWGRLCKEIRRLERKDWW